VSDDSETFSIVQPQPPGHSAYAAEVLIQQIGYVKW